MISSRSHTQAVYRAEHELLLFAVAIFALGKKSLRIELNLCRLARHTCYLLSRQILLQDLDLRAETRFSLFERALWYASENTRDDKEGILAGVEPASFA